jgi:ubiquinone/menaquinone biosynthesis C-methylase UbiE
MNTDLVAYYKARAAEYEKIYAKPERQEDLKEATTILQHVFAGKEVLEIACGTGYWTERIAKTAASIYAIDINESVLEVARLKDWSNQQVTFGLADLFDFPYDKKYESLFAGFIWSHILLQDLDQFLSLANNLVVPGGTVVIMDNNFVEGSNHPITSIDAHGNSFQARQLEDGSSHLVLKNFPTEEFLREKIKGIAGDIQIFNLTYYWILCFTTKTDQGQ